MFKISVGSSTSPDTAEAIGAAIAQCLAHLGPHQPAAGVLINDGHAQDKCLLRTISDTWPGMPLIGAASENAATTRRVTLMLIDSPDLDFHFGIGKQRQGNPGLAAEAAISQSAEHRLDRVSLCLTLHDPSSEWQQTFQESIRRLLPAQVTFLNELLPHEAQAQNMALSRYYCGKDVLLDASPIMVGTLKHDLPAEPGWSLTRQHGVLRKSCGDQVFLYDNFVGDRRRASRIG